MIHAAWSLASLGTAWLLLAEAWGRIGGGVTEWAEGRRRSPLAAWGMGYLAGWSAAGAALLGLALTGLCTRGAIWGVLALLLAGSRPAWRRDLMTWGAAREACARMGRGLALVGLAALPGLYGLLVPEDEQDALIYHLGLPWQLLQSHRAVVSWVPAAFHLPLPLDLGFMVPLLLGEERLAKWLESVAADLKS